jgi:hypothetical protein
MVRACWFFLMAILMRENLSKEQVVALDGAPRDGTAKYELWQQIRVLVR